MLPTRKVGTILMCQLHSTWFICQEKYQTLQDENTSLRDELSALREQLAKLQAQGSDKE